MEHGAPSTDEFFVSECDNAVAGACTMLPTMQRDGTTTSGVQQTQNSGAKRKRAARSAVMRYWTHIHDRLYRCELCFADYPNGPQGRVQRPKDGSTNVFWRHFKAAHQQLHDQLKEIEDGSGMTHTQKYMTDYEEGPLKLQPPKKKPLKGLTVEETKDIITRFVCLTDSPWSIVDHNAFKELWRYATQLDLDPPSAKVIKAWALKMYGRMKEQVVSMLASVRHVTLTVDAWTAENGCGLLGITGHWVNAQWEYQEIVLTVREITGKHDGENMAAIVYDVLVEFKIETKVSVILFKLVNS